jgi:hypothetical protein
MQYMLLIHTSPDVDPRHGTPEFDKLLGDHYQLIQAMQEAGVYVGGNALQPTVTATSLRVRDGKRETMDGPFAVTKEALGGYYLVDCPDLDAALGWAARVPEAQWGTIEVRPVVIFG